MESFYIKNQKIILIILVFLFIIIGLSIVDNFNYLKFGFFKFEKLHLSFTKNNPLINSVSVDNTCSINFTATVRNSQGSLAKGIEILIYEKNKQGSFVATKATTNENGKCYFSYSPPNVNSLNNLKSKKITIYAKIAFLDVQKKLTLNLVNIPVVFVHGYQSNPAVFEVMKTQFSNNGLISSAFKYESNQGILAASRNLSQYLVSLKLDYLKNGIHVERFDIVSHSMGGLISRNYTSTQKYLYYQNNIRKLIFISTPHNGSPVANLGASYVKNTAIKDLATSSKFITKTLPNSYNMGLNNHLQVGNIIALHDEVVSESSADLIRWGIKTKVYEVGPNSLSVNNIFNGDVLKSPNHNYILNNTEIIEQIIKMLKGKLPRPLKIN